MESLRRLDCRKQVALSAFYLFPDESKRFYSIPYLWNVFLQNSREKFFNPNKP